MSLNNAQIRRLRGLGHDLSPVVIVADKGLTDNVMAEIETALDAHELVKIKLRGERSARREWAGRIVERTGAQLVQSIGQVALLFRRNPDNPRIALD
ncbi:MAG: YhbY family RNA-binding protein [Candidatus Wenzhouxiangella sp. M2_3B_020]